MAARQTLNQPTGGGRRAQKSRRLLKLQLFAKTRLAKQAQQNSAWLTGFVSTAETTAEGVAQQAVGLCVTETVPKAAAAQNAIVFKRNMPARVLHCSHGGF